MPEEEDVEPGSCFILFEGEDFGQGGRGPSASKSGSGSNRFSRLSEPSLIFCRVDVCDFETGTAHLYFPTDFFSSS